MSKLVKHFVEEAMTFVMEAVVKINCVSLKRYSVYKSLAVYNVTQASRALVRVMHTHYIIYVVMCI